MRVLCIGDSLGLPREECPYEATWFYRLNNFYEGIDFVDYFVRGVTIQDLLERFDTYFQYYEPDVVIIQTGVVDCAPRYINDRKFFIRALIRLFRVLKCDSLFWRLIKQGKRRTTCVYTNFDLFLSSYDELVKKFINRKTNRVILIEIGHAAESTLQSSPYFNHNVDKYNEAIKEVQLRHPNEVAVVSPLAYIEEKDFVDGYHCSPQGMEKVFIELKKAIYDYATGE